MQGSLPARPGRDGVAQVNKIDTEMDRFSRAVDAFLALPEDEQLRRLEECAARAKEESDRFDQAIRFSDEEWRRFLHQPMTI